MGGHTLAVPMELHQVNRRRLCDRLRPRSDVPEGALIVLQGGDSFPRYCSDVDVCIFRQVSKTTFLIGSVGMCAVTLKTILYRPL